MEIHSLAAEPVARCKFCGDPNIVGVCHHCSSGLCPSHVTNGARGSREFQGLGIRRKGRGEDAVHCADCVHRLISTGELATVMGISVALSLFVFLATRSVIVLGIVVLFLLAVAMLLAFIARRQRINEQLDRCPILPEIDNQRIVETYRYRSKLESDGQWRHTVVGTEGVARADLRFSPDDVVRVRHRSPRAATEPLEAGFVVFDMMAPSAVDGLNLVDDGNRFGGQRVTFAPDQIPPYLLTGSLAAPPAAGANGSPSDVDEPDQPEPTTGGRRPPSVHKWEQRYKVRVAQHKPPMPVLVFPTLAPDSNRQTLELHLSWSSAGGPIDPIADRAVHSLESLHPFKIDFLEFRVPLGDLGGVVPIDGDPIIRDEPSNGSRLGLIRWEQVAIRPDEPSKRLSVRFGRPLPPGLRIEGNLVANFQNSATGLRGMRWFDPLGKPLAIPTSREGRSSGSATATIVDLAFEFSMSAVPYETKFVQLEKPIALSGSVPTRVRPDHETAIALSEELTDAGFSVFQVREATFSPADRSAEENRVWELRGRSFAEQIPFDFQVKITGADLRRRVDRSDETAQLTELTVAAQAAYDGPEREQGVRQRLGVLEQTAGAALARLSRQTATDPSTDHPLTGINDPIPLDRYRPVDDTDHPAPSPPPTNGSTPPRDFDITNYRQQQRCSVCKTVDEHADYALCHHCGRQLCLRRCSIRVKRDRAFARGADRQDISASHCIECLREHHFGALFVEVARRNGVRPAFRLRRLRRRRRAADN